MSIDIRRMQEALPHVVVPKTLNVVCRDLYEERDLDKIHYEKNQEERDLGERIDADLLIDIESIRFFNQHDKAKLPEFVEAYFRFEGTIAEFDFKRKLRWMVECGVKEAASAEEAVKGLVMDVPRAQFIPGYTLLVFRLVGERFFPKESEGV